MLHEEAGRRGIRIEHGKRLIGAAETADRVTARFDDVFFTGGSKGMGRIAARMLADEGCKVAVVARSKGPVDDAVSEITASGGTAIGVTADISQQEQVTAAVEQVTRELGAPQIVIGQTLFTKPGDFDDITDPEVYVDSFRAYTMSTVYLLKAVLPAMKEALVGRRFVHVGSATAKEPEGAIHHVVANGTRPSTIGLLKTVADEYAQFGVTVNTVAPGWIETQNAIAYLDRQAGLARGAQALDEGPRPGPAARMGRPEEIAEHDRVPLLRAGRDVNGAWIEVDGAHHRSAFLPRRAPSADWREQPRASPPPWPRCRVECTLLFRRAARVTIGVPGSRPTEENSMEIAGKKAVIVGGASGMARASAKRLHERGASVAILDLPKSAGAEAAKELDGPSTRLTSPTRQPRRAR